MTTYTFSNTSTGQSGTRQSWSVQQSGWYAITAEGAQGSGTLGGYGASMMGYFFLRAGQSLSISVGQQGKSYDATRGHCAGGGTAVCLPGAADESGILVIAGGGGANTNAAIPDRSHGQITTYGAGTGAGVNGNGGTYSSGFNGGGFYTAGSGSGSGDSYLNGWIGASGWVSVAAGGFGGGGATLSQYTAGGGGGYSGGGHYGGGGSLISLESDYWGAIGPMTTGARTGHGQVVIETVEDETDGLVLIEQEIRTLNSEIPRIVAFDWTHPARHAVASRTSRRWSTFVPRGSQYGLYYLSSDNRCPPIIHGPYSAE
jgi:hypothetical protein